ncbi:MAG: transcription-repair coupling factor [Bdellovibrio sp.]|nr:transcription-repair coupling factor [Bdellovibrio sp.]
MSVFFSEFSPFLRSVTSGSRVHFAGGTPAAYSLLLAMEITAHVKALRTTQKDVTSAFVIVVPNEDSALEFISDLETLLPCIAPEEAPCVRVFHLPSWEQSPYSSVSLSMRTRFSRVTALHAARFLAKDSAKDFAFPVWVATPAALSQATLSPQRFDEISLVLAIGESVSSREALLTRLESMGYEKVETVEDRGSFAARGDIIDLFPPQTRFPIRVELFGDQIERIREFDPDSQRALSEPKASLSKITIPPAREVLMTKDTIPRLREKIKAFSDDRDIPRTTRDPVLESLNPNLSPVYLDHSEAWAPFAYAKVSTFFDFLPFPPILFLYDELSIHQEWKVFFEEQARLSKERSTTDPIVPDPEALFLWQDVLEKKIKAFTQVYLNRVMLSTSETFAAPSVDQQSRSLQLQPLNIPQQARKSLNEVESEFHLWLKQGFRILALAPTQGQLERLKYLLDERGFSPALSHPAKPGQITLGVGSVSSGLIWPSAGWVILNEHEIIGGQPSKRPRSSSKRTQGSSGNTWAGLQALADLSVGDFVVHRDHGVGRYLGLSRLSLSGAPSDFLILEYAKRDKLYLPVYRLNVIQKYVGSGEKADLDQLGTQQFLKTKERVKNSVKTLAFDLLQLYAKRKLQNGMKFSARDTLFREFEAQFPYEETPDQLSAIESVVSDLESGRVMDRLVCGDVGYGKTEVAIRAAFKAVNDGKQVAVLVPTTVLAHQHELTFKGRLGNYPVIIESLSRFKTKKEQTQILENLAAGKTDIVIGTHRLISKDVRFADLGLVIVDEEHRFGVGHKEKLKTLKLNTHFLTLTATPIPRTLHMALSGLRDISLINTPPIDRLPVKTFVSKYDESIVKTAIEKELARGGQVFFLSNRVQTIHETARRVQELVPHAKVLVAHGQMPEKELEEAMDQFYQKRANVLVCTTIIESGLDLPLANTILIQRADNLGLAQLYQIRGRVGRGQVRAYAYLFVPQESVLSEDARKRLEVIQKFVELGSGFNIASHDLEIRGGGDLLGPQQSGSIAAVGFDLYIELLEQAVRELEGKPIASEEGNQEPEIKIPFPAFLAEEYIPDVHQRLSMYRRFSSATQDSDIDRLEEEVRDRFGAPPSEAQNLFWLLRIKLLLKRFNIEAITVGPEKVSLSPGPKSKLNPVRAIALVSAHPHQYQLLPDSKLVARLPASNLRDLLFGLENLFKQFS